VVVGFPGTTLRDPHRYALELIQEACSDLGSRLFLRIRDQLGLAYFVGAQHLAGLGPGYFSLYAGTSPSRSEQVAQELLNEAASLATKGLTEEELSRVKAKVIGQRKISRQDPGTLAFSYALDELYGLGFSHGEHEDGLYQAVTLEEVQHVARLYLQTSKAVIAIVSGTEDQPTEASGGDGANR
jgi:zinc protease